MRKSLKFISLALCLTVALGGGYGYYRYHGKISNAITVLQNHADKDVGVFFVRQLVAQDNATQRTIMFAAKAKQNYSLEYKKKGGKSQTAKAQDVSFTDGEAKYVQYVVKLAKLEPSSTYEYRVVTEKNKGAWHKLETDNGKGYTAMIFADSQSSNYNTWQNMAAKAHGQEPKAKLYLNLGDQVDNGQHQYQWGEWFRGVEAFSADIPMAVLVGNHEAYDLDWNERFPKAYINLFYLPSAMEKYKHQFYSFDYGPVHFTVLDTNYKDEMRPFKPNEPYDMIRWARRDLANSEAKWKVVLMHRDIFMYAFSKESGRPCDWNTYIDYSGQDFIPMFNKYGVDAVLSGHLHTYRRRQLKGFESSKNGITYIMSGVSGDQSYGNLWADFEWDLKRSPDKKDPGNYMTMTVTDNTLTLRAFMPDGKQFDEVVLKK